MSKSKKSWGLWVLLALALAGGGGFYFYKNKERKKNAEPSYREVTIEKGQIDVTVLSTGVVQPQNRLEIKPPIAGRVEQILVNEGDKVKPGQILAWMSSTERAALIDSARAKGAEELKRWEEMYRPTPIISPIGGTVILRKVETGQTFSSADAVFVLSDRLTVKAQVDETDLAKIKLGQKAKIIMDAYPGNPIDGRVDKLAFEAVTTNNVTTYTTDVVPIETPDIMRSGMTANVTFYTESKSDILILPTEAIRSEDGETYVLMKATQPKTPPAHQAIKLGLSDGERTEVVSGLKEGDTVLISEAKLEAEQQSKNPFSPFGSGRSGAGRRGSGGGR